MLMITIIKSKDIYRLTYNGVKTLHNTITDATNFLLLLHSLPDPPPELIHKIVNLFTKKDDYYTTTEIETFTHQITKFVVDPTDQDRYNLTVQAVAQVLKELSPFLDTESTQNSAKFAAGIALLHKKES